MFPGDRNGELQQQFEVGPHWHNALFERILQQEGSFADQTLWFHSLAHAWANKEVSVSSLFASWSPEILRSYFKAPRQTELVFLVRVSQLSLLLEELHLICSASGRVLSRLHFRHWGIDGREHIETLCVLYIKLFPPHTQVSVFFTWQGRGLRPAGQILKEGM